MVIIEKPFVSEFLKETLLKHNLPVLRTDVATEMLGEGLYNFVEPTDLIRQAAKGEPLHIYTPSENSIGWISDNLNSTTLPEQINFFKDKYVFRKITENLYPDFKFKAIRFEDLDTTNPNDLFFPLILKPAVGFLSMGVYKVKNEAQWNEVIKKIHKDLDNVKDIYPNAVLNTTRFIVEEIIEGDEYAIDAYFNNDGEPVILGILKHIFGSDKDVSDRVYFTSGKVVAEKMEAFKEFITKLGNLTNLKNFPLHAEVRVDKNGKIIPIEVNPMRFGGWCTSADLTNKAFGINPYVYYHEQKAPNWDELINKNPGKVYSIIILDNSTPYKSSDIKQFDYDQLLTKFRKPLEMREIDYALYHHFGFLFTETLEEEFHELEYILKSTLEEFVTV